MTTIVHKRGDTLELSLQLKSNDIAVDITGTQSQASSGTLRMPYWLQTTLTAT